MRRKNFYLSGMMAVFTAVVMSLSMVACGGSDDDTEDDINGSSGGGSSQKGVHQLDISFSGDTGGWSVDNFYFFSTDADGGYTKISGNDGSESDRYIYYESFGNYSVKSDDQSWSVHCGITLIRKSDSAKPVKINVTGKVKNKTTYTKEYEANPQYKRVSLLVHSPSTDFAKLQNFDY